MLGHKSFQLSGCVFATKLILIMLTEGNIVDHLVCQLETGVYKNSWVITTISSSTTAPDRWENPLAAKSLGRSRLWFCILSFKIATKMQHSDWTYSTYPPVASDGEYIMSRSNRNAQQQFLVDNGLLTCSGQHKWRVPTREIPDNNAGASLG